MKHVVVLWNRFIYCLIALVFLVIGGSIALGYGRFAIASGNSMKPTLKDQELLWIVPAKNLRRGDIVIANYDQEPFKEKLVKRIVGLPKESIMISKGKVYVEKKYLREPYLVGNGKVSNKYYEVSYNRQVANLSEDDEGNYELDQIVPVGNYFLMGDNRKVSVDSRLLGPMAESSIVGKVAFRSHLTKNFAIVLLSFFVLLILVFPHVYLWKLDDLSGDS